MSAGDDDAWLYGDEDADPGPPPGEGDDGDVEATETNKVDEEADLAAVVGAGATVGAEEDENVAPPQGEAEGDDSSDDDDNIEITIDKDKIEAAKTSYQNLQLQKTGHEFSKKEKKGKFSVEEFGQVGVINGEAAVEFDLEGLEDKPWRKPGADITDYFNYGFTEETWTAYCNRQKSLRGNEAGVAVLPSAPILTSNKTSTIHTINSNLASVPLLGGGELSAGAIVNKPKIVSTLKQVEVKPEEPSGITVMTHEKRIYSNKVISEIYDFSLPPPGGVSVPTLGGGAGFSVPPPVIPSELPPPTSEEFTPAQFPASEFPPAEAFSEQPYSGGYEPTAEAQWSLPPPHYNTSLPPPNLQPPPTSVPVPIPDYYGASNPDRYRESDRYRDSDRYPDRDSDRYRSYDRDRRPRDRRRSRSRDRDRYSERDRVRVKRERRSRSRSPRRDHKKRRSDRDSDRDKDRSDRETDPSSVKIKEEKEDSTTVAPPGEN